MFSLVPLLVFFMFFVGIRSKRERSASRVLPYIMRALATTTPGVTNVEALLVTHDLGELRCVLWCEVVFLPLEVPAAPVCSTGPSLDAAARGLLWMMLLTWLLVPE